MLDEFTNFVLISLIHVKKHEILVTQCNLIYNKLTTVQGHSIVNNITCTFYIDTENISLIG